MLRELTICALSIPTPPPFAARFNAIFSLDMHPEGEGVGQGSSAHQRYVNVERGALSRLLASTKGKRVGGTCCLCPSDFPLPTYSCSENTEACT